jgi:hypothetical protein
MRLIFLMYAQSIDTYRFLYAVTDGAQARRMYLRWQAVHLIEHDRAVRAAV